MPVHPWVLKIAKSLWQMPSSIPPTSKKAEKRDVPTKGFEYLYTVSRTGIPGCVKRDRQDHVSDTPKNKDAKRLDLFDRKVYSSAGVQLRVSDHQASLGRYLTSPTG